jgi:hypothetical protein
MPDDKDTNPTNDDTQEDEGTQAGDDQAAGKDWKAEADKWKAMSRKHEAEAKANRGAADKLKEFEDKDKSEVQRLTDKAAAADQRATDAEAKALRYEVAADKGIQPKHLKYLTGTTKEEIEESATGIIEDFPEVYKTAKDEDGKSESRRPQERLRPGAAPDEEPDETDPRKLAAKIPRI